MIRHPAYWNYIICQWMKHPLTEQLCHFFVALPSIRHKTNRNHYLRKSWDTDRHVCSCCRVRCTLTKSTLYLRCLHLRCSIVCQNFKDGIGILPEPGLQFEGLRQKDRRLPQDTATEIWFWANAIIFRIVPWEVKTQGLFEDKFDTFFSVREPRNFDWSPKTCSTSVQ